MYFRPIGSANREGFKVKAKFSTILGAYIYFSIYIYIYIYIYIDLKSKHLTPEGNSELNFVRDEVEGNIEILGKQNSLFPKGLVI